MFTPLSVHSSILRASVVLHFVWNLSDYWKNDLLQDVASAGGPDKWRGFGVVVSDVLVDGVDQLARR